MNITNTPEDERQAKGGKTWKERDKKKKREREQAPGKFMEEWHCLLSYFKEGDTAGADSTALRRGEEGLAFLFSCPTVQR